MSASILLVEDHSSTWRTLVLYLEREGYTVHVETNGLDAYASAMANNYDLIILDLMLPKMDGREVCQRLRLHSNVPIIMLTALTGEADVIKGLNLGADDYVAKPFSPRELMARVRARLRDISVAADEIQVGELRLDNSSRQFFFAEQPLSLTKSEYLILEVLIRTPGRVYSRDELIERALGHDYEGTTKNIDIHISNIRKRLGENPQAPAYVETVIGHGYRMSKTQ